MEETRSEMMIAFLEVQKAMKEFREGMKELREEVKELYECWKSQADSIGDDTDEDLTVHDDGTREVYSHDDSNFSILEHSDAGEPDDNFNGDDSDPAPADARSTSELGNNNTSKPLNFTPKLECPKFELSTIFVPELFDESPKKGKSECDIEEYVRIDDVDETSNEVDVKKGGEIDFGRKNSSGTQLFCVSGHVNKPCTVEVEMNILILDPGGIQRSVVAVWHLQIVLSKKRDLFTHLMLIDEVMQEGDSMLIDRAWKTLVKTFAIQMKSVFTTSTFVREISWNIDVKGVLPAMNPEVREQMISAIVIFQTSFLALCLSRLSDQPIEKCLGNAKMDKNSGHDVVLVGGSTRIPTVQQLKDQIEERCEELMIVIVKSTIMFDTKKTQERLLKLSGSVAVFNGGASKAEVGERKDRVTDALNATRAVVEEGIVPVGRVATVSVISVSIFDPGGGAISLSALILRYAICGRMNDPSHDWGEDKTSVSWNCMIAGFVINGHNMEALELLNRVMAAEIDPSRLTIVVVLKLCANIQELGSARQAAIAWALERKPNAFRRMASQHITLNTEDDAKSLTEGCHCKKSGCLKNYCSCFRAYSLCSEQCTCMNCKNLEGNQELLAFGSGMTASKLTKLDPENLAIAGSVGQSGYQDFANKNDQNLQSLNTEDPSPIELEQTHQLVNPRSGDQLLAPTTEGSSKLAYMSLLAGFIQPQDVKELSVSLIVVSEANNDFKEKHYSTNLQAEGENHMLIIDSPANQDVEQSHGLVDQNAKTKYYLQDALVATSELDPRSCDNDQHNERPVSPGTLELKCDKEDALVTSNMILDYGWNTIYTEQEMLILVTFCDHLIKLIAHGKVQERQLSMSDHFGADNQHEAVVLDHNAEP